MCQTVDLSIVLEINHLDKTNFKWSRSCLCSFFFMSLMSVNCTLRWPSLGTFMCSPLHCSIQRCIHSQSQRLTQYYVGKMCGSWNYSPCPSWSLWPMRWFVTGREKLQFRSGNRAMVLCCSGWLSVIIQALKVEESKEKAWPLRGPLLDFAGARRRPCQGMWLILDAESTPQTPDSKEIGSPNTRKQIWWATWRSKRWILP